MRFMTLAFALMTLPTFVSAQCLLKDAVYRPIGHSDAKYNDGNSAQSARHVARKGVMSQAEHILILGNVRASYQFGFAFPNGHGGTALAYEGKVGAKPAKTKDDSDLRIIYFNKALQEVEASGLKLDAPAPAYLIMPGMGAAFWYGFDTDRQFVPANGLWKADCVK